MKFGTKLIHNSSSVDQQTGALSIPIYQASTFHQSDIDLPPRFDYSRSGNPTRKALEDSAALLEGGDAAFAFSSGIAATSSALAIFGAGDHLIVSEDIYGGTYRICETLFKRFNLEVTYVDMSDISEVRKQVKENTKAIFVETPSNPLLKITDIKEIVGLAQEKGLLTIADNTFMSPYLQRPLEMGVDIVVHSATKFMGGHSDVLGGIVVVKGEELGKRIYQVQNGFGAVLGPQDSWLIMRGLKTLKVRLDVQQATAHELASWLQAQKTVGRVYYPGLENHPGRHIHFTQSAGGGAVLSFEAVNVEKARSFMKRVQLAAVAVSLGGVETICSYPVKMSHAAMPKAERERRGITDSLIRVSVGLEEFADLRDDFQQALA